VSKPMAGGAKDQVARLLALVPYLHQRGEVELSVASAALGVPVTQLVKDLKVLLMCGLPGGFPDDLIDVDLDVLVGAEDDERASSEGIIRISNADYLARPLRLTATEASALIVALRAIRAGADAVTAPIVDRALGKLETAAAEGSAEVAHIDPGTPPTGLASLRARLSAAAIERRQIELTYWVPSRDEESVRVVDPIGVVTANGFDYLDAWCHLAEAPRLFRLDRIHRAETLSSRVLGQPQRRDLTDGVFGMSYENATLVTLRLAPEARWVPEYYPVEAVRRPGAGILEIDLLVGDEQWLTRLLLRLAPAAEVIAPAHLTQRFLDFAQATLDLYQGSTVETA
jgi:proteasome accessory factor C